ncbi:MAG: NAD(+) synthase [Paludibacteraceae bacterium]|nr:NAD(+) synthase [Paludibacteraceae bacterium]
MMEFNVATVTSELVAWIREFFEKNGKGCNAVIGISGGKDSSVVAALCVEALGKDRVVGVLMPQNTQSDIQFSHDLCDFLGIKRYVIDIGSTVSSLLSIIHCRATDMEISKQTEINLPARIRMATLYAVSQSCNGRVANTCNLSEDWIGYSTRYGDAAGDFSPCSHLISDEVIAIGEYLGLPEELTRKVPSDGLCGKTDEDNFGFTYEVLNKYIRTGVCENPETKARIDEMHAKNLFKLELMPSFEYSTPYQPNGDK